MSLASITPAAGRIAEIRSVLGRNPTGGGDFGQRLDAVIDVDRAAMSVDEAVSVDEAMLDRTPTTTLAAPVPTSTYAVSTGGPYAQLFNEAGARHGVDPDLLAAVAEVESGFDPNAVSHAGAGGLMQFMPATAEEMGVDRFEPASAIDGAARYLARDLARFGDLRLAIAAYNAGPGAVAEYGGVPPFPETQHYVDKVLSALESRR